MKTFIIAALSADGFIGRSSSHYADWTGKADKAVFVRLTKAAGTVVMGSKTFATIGRALPDRRTLVYTRHPDEFTATEAEATNEEPSELLERLQKEGATEVAICGGRDIYDLFITAGVVNELYLTVVPTLFGSGVTLFSHEFSTNLELLDVTNLADGAVLLHYKIVN